jgi:hypothetical protein
VVGIALAPQAGAVEGDQRRVGLHPPVELPPVRREQPRPAEQVAVVQRLERHRIARGDVQLERDRAVADRVEGVCLLALPEQVLPGFGAHVRRTPGDQLELRGREPAEGGHLRDQGIHLPHCFPSGHAGGPPLSVARIAATSSVMSIATGHHVMHRPQPTQPNVSN